MQNSIKKLLAASLIAVGATAITTSDMSFFGSFVEAQATQAKLEATPISGNGQLAGTKLSPFALKDIAEQDIQKLSEILTGTTQDQLVLSDKSKFLLQGLIQAQTLIHDKTKLTGVEELTPTSLLWLAIQTDKDRADKLAEQLKILVTQIATGVDKVQSVGLIPSLNSLLLGIGLPVTNGDQLKAIHDSIILAFEGVYKKSDRFNKINSVFSTLSGSQLTVKINTIKSTQESEIIPLLVKEHFAFVTSKVNITEDLVSKEFDSLVGDSSLLHGQFEKVKTPILEELGSFVGEEHLTSEIADKIKDSQAYQNLIQKEKAIIEVNKVLQSNNLNAVDISSLTNELQMTSPIKIPGTIISEDFKIESMTLDPGQYKISEGIEFPGTKAQVDISFQSLAQKFAIEQVNTGEDFIQKLQQLVKENKSIKDLEIQIQEQTAKLNQVQLELTQKNEVVEKELQQVKADKDAALLKVQQLTDETTVKEQEIEGIKNKMRDLDGNLVKFVDISKAMSLDSTEIGRQLTQEIDNPTEKLPEVLELFVEEISKSRKAAPETGSEIKQQSSEQERNEAVLAIIEEIGQYGKGDKRDTIISNLKSKYEGK